MKQALFAGIAFVFVVGWTASLSQAAPLPAINTGDLYVTWENSSNTREVADFVSFRTTRSGISSYDPTGALVDPSLVVSNFERYRGIAFGGEDLIYVSTFTGSSFGNVETFDAAGTHLGTFADMLDRPEGIAVNSEGHVFVAQRNFSSIGASRLGSIVEFDAAGNELDRISRFDARSMLDLAFDAADNLYWTSGSDLWKHDSNNDPITKITADGLGRPQSIAFDQAGNYYVSHRAISAGSSLGGGVILGEPGAIFVFDSSDNLITSFTDDALGDPYDLAIDERGKLWVSDTLNGQLLVFDTTTINAPVLVDQITTHQFPVELAFRPLAVPEPGVLGVDFISDTTMVNPGGTVNFIEQSTGGGFLFDWTFGAGEGTSILDNPAYQYNTPGLFDVGLTVGHTLDSAALTKVGFIEVVQNEAAFAIGEGAVHPGQSVQFSDKSNGFLESWEWQVFWQDGGFALVATSDERNPIFQFDNPGTYHVQLFVDNTLPGNGRDFHFQAGALNVVPVPEPGTLILLGAGLAGWTVRKKRRRRLL